MVNFRNNLNYIFAALLLILTLAISGCQTATQSEEVAHQWPMQPLESPAGQQSGEPNLFAAEDGRLFLSWIDEVGDDQHALRFAKWEDHGWSVAQTIAQDSGWFVNWADFPSLAAQDDFMAAHWLAKSGEGTFDYDVKVSISRDEGQSWSTPFTLHRDGIPAEHGFVTMLPVQDEEIFAVWLDGRQTKMDGADDHSEHGHGHGGGAMTLYATTFDSSRRMGEEMALDMRICDCCQTDAVKTEDGLFVVYRDRSEEEIRDIYCMRQVNGKWTEPQPVHEDNWQIAGCPVNGPATAAQAHQVAVAWYTAAEEKPRVQLALSEDNGVSFDAPIRLDHGNPSGRVDVIYLDDKHLMVSWMESNGKGADIRAALVNTDGEVIADHPLVATAASRSSGFPIMEKAEEKVFFAWTEVGEDKTQVRTAYVSMHEILETI
jgi:hypothetical protein